MRSIKPQLFLLFLLPVCIFLTFNKHSKDKAHSYHGVIWADASGYYSYLPAWFIYGNDASQFPANAPELCGNGFHFDKTTNRVVTKYFCGSAILMTPFFTGSHLLAPLLGYPRDGFSAIYSYGLYLSGMFYCSLGLYFLSLFLQKHFSTILSVGTAFLFFISTNLYYYSIDSPAMSHVYSFFLFTLFMYSTQRLLTSEKSTYIIIFVVSFVLAILTRPTNGLIILFPFFYENGHFISRIRSLVKNKMAVITALLIGFLCILPQLIYFKQTYGSPAAYSYGDEGFSNLLHPHLPEVWFSPNNGLFIYAPILLLPMIGMIGMMRNKTLMGYYIFFTFLFISYLFASWWNWWFGCSLGARSFVEFYALLAIPMAYCIDHLLKSRWKRLLLLIFTACCVIMYFKMEYYYDGCFYGDTWDWNAWKQQF